MKFLTLAAIALLPALSACTPLKALRDASPVAVTEFPHLKAINIKTRDAGAESVGLFKRVDCDIVHVVTTVGCWWLPTHDISNNHKIANIAGTVNNINFSCYARCQNIEGITAWYWTYDYSKTISGVKYDGCYVPGYYTDNNCRSTGSAAMDRCAWASNDERIADC